MRQKIIVGKVNADPSDRWLLFLWIGAILVNLKGIFTDFGPDQSYAIATSYRHLMGDHLFVEMWEPHQTSSFLTDMGMLIYGKIIPSWNGVAVFLQLYGVLLYGAVTYALFRTLRKKLSRELSHFICLFVFVNRAKLMVFPEFSNMHMGFELLLLSCFCLFLERQEKTGYLVIAAVCLCLQILSYPSCLITYMGVILILLLFTEQKRRNMLIFTGVCVIIGGVYTGYFVLRMGLSGFLENLTYIFCSDVSHTATCFSPAVFFRGTVYGALWLAIGLAAAYLLHKILHRSFLNIFLGILMVTDIGMLFMAPGLGVDWNYIYFMINPMIMIVAVFCRKKLDEKEKKIWWTGMILSICSAFAVLLLTNQELLSVFAYMIPATAVSFIPIEKALRSESVNEQRTLYLARILFCSWIMIHRFLAVYGYINVSGGYLLTDVENIVRVGPTMGIVTSLDECNQARYGSADWQNHIADGEKVFLVENSWYDPIAYLYAGGGISAYSTIDTPAYDDSVLAYWTKYPDKAPDVIAVKVWGGGEDIPCDSWFEQYLHTHYELSGEGMLWHFYRPR